MPAFNSQNDHPPFSFLSTITQLVFRYFHKITISPSSEADSLILPITSNSITRMRLNSVNSQPLGYLPIHINSLGIEIQSYQPRPSVRLGKTIMSLTFQAVVALALSSSTGEAEHGHLLPIHSFTISMVIAFAASFCGIFLYRSYPKSASIIENVGSVIAAVGFSIMASIFLPGKITWITWLACAISLLAFFLSLVKTK